MLRSTPCGRTGFSRGQFALGDAVRPVAEVTEWHAAERTRQQVDHLRARLAGRHAAHPRLGGVREGAELLRDFARGFLPELVTADAAVVAHGVEPVLLRDLGRYVARSAEVLGRRNLQHRVPVDRGVVFRGGSLVRRGHRLEIETLTGLSVDLGRINEAVATYPHLVLRLRKVRHDEAAHVVGHHHLGVARGQVAGFRDHPDASLRTLRAHNHAADVVVVDGYGGGRVLLSIQGQG